jgi:sn-glycerol 3-phosphate transport system permease protein
MPAEGTAGNTENTVTFVVTDLQPPDETSPPQPPAPETQTAAGVPVPPRRPRRRLRTLGSYAMLTAFAIIILFPIYVTIVNSLLPPDQLVRQPPPLFPTSPQWGHYATAWTSGSMSKYMATSGVMTAIIVVGQLVTSILAAYAFAFLHFPFKRTLFVVCLATLMIPLEVTFITNLDTVTSLHWFNSYEGLSIPFLATGFGIFLMRQAFLQIPRDLQEAAQLDGYGHLRFMTRVAVPLARPSLAALAVFSFLGAWNQYLWPLVSTGGSTPLYTVQLGLKQLLGTQVSQIPVALAGAVIAFVPLVILLLIFQKQLVRSLTAGAVK